MYIVFVVYDDNIMWMVVLISVSSRFQPGPDLYTGRYTSTVSEANTFRQFSDCEVVASVYVALFSYRLCFLPGLMSLATLAEQGFQTQVEDYDNTGIHVTVIMKHLSCASAEINQNPSITSLSSLITRRKKKIKFNIHLFDDAYYTPASRWAQNINAMW